MMSREFPGGSKSRVDRAGESVRSNCASEEDLEVIDEWRAAHRGVLNTFQSILRTRSRGKDITVAQRHKRKNTIFNKLDRLPRMRLSSMGDVAGCRVIFNDISELYDFRSELHGARFNHRLKNDLDLYDYIKSPKSTGYRSVHDVYEYNVNSDHGRDLKGLNIEVQYRTLVQHAWATAVEVVGLVTESQPKFKQGDERYIIAMAYASEILARAHEDRKGPFPEKSNYEVIDSFTALDEEISLTKKLRGLHMSRVPITSRKNIILIINPDGKLDIKSYRSGKDAFRGLLRFEAEMPDSDIVFVRADSKSELRVAFRNYFRDSRDFIDLLDYGVDSLRGGEF